MRQTRIARTMIRIRNRMARPGTLGRSLRYAVLPVIGVLLATQLVTAAPAFKSNVTVTDALLKSRHSQLWKQHPGFDDKDSQYLVAARRSDGTVAIITRSLDDPKPGSITAVGYFMKCGVRKDWTIFIANAAGFNAALAHPSIDDPTIEGSELPEESANDVLYQRVCDKRQ